MSYDSFDVIGYHNPLGHYPAPVVAVGESFKSPFYYLVAAYPEGEETSFVNLGWILSSYESAQT